MIGISRYLSVAHKISLLMAESEMIAIEKGLTEKAASLTPLKIAGIYKDIINHLDEAANYFEDGMKPLSSSARSGFKRYYFSFCHAMKAYHEASHLFLTPTAIDQLLVLLRDVLRR